ncbi:dihydrofolate reductase [Sphingomonas sp. RT2P30]|uniref:dihydrofolate reductase n=1 Tax=Parasphingomonas halimpatiens TaxID=3096162 RepID=UPI002FC7F61D
MITLIFAHAENGVIGRDGKIPWHLSADLRRFKALTMGKPMIMGRKTFESFPAPLPGRRHIVLTRDAGWSAPGAETASTLADALALAGPGDVMVIGGAEIFALFEDIADRAEVTAIRQHFDGDTSYRLDQGGWEEVGREDHPADGDLPAYTFFTLARRPD